MSETPDADQLVEQWYAGEVDPNDADVFEIEDETAKAKFLTDDGPVIFCFVLDAAFRPTDAESTSLEQFDPYEADGSGAAANPGP